MTIKHPMHPKEVTPEWVTHALREGGCLKEASVQKLTQKILGGEKGFLSSVIRLQLEYDREEAGAPKTVVAKIEPESDTFREYGEELHAFQREIRFYKEVAPQAPFRLPTLFFAVEDPPAYSMLMEDLSHFTPGDQIVGMHKQQVLTAVEHIAKLQALYWNNQALEKLSWMPVTNNVSFDFPDQWDGFVKNFGQFLKPEGIEVGEKLAENIQWLEAEISKRPKTIVHCDLREDNLLFGKTGTENEVLILDWQLVTRTIGAFDVARVVDGSEVPEERKGHQMNILRWWHDTLIQEGVTGYSWEDAQYDFQLAALLCLSYPVHFHEAFAGSEGRKKDLAQVLISRHFASVVELNAQSVLPK